MSWSHHSDPGEAEQAERCPTPDTTPCPLTRPPGDQVTLTPLAAPAFLSQPDSRLRSGRPRSLGSVHTHPPRPGRRPQSPANPKDFRRSLQLREVSGQLAGLTSCSPQPTPTSRSKLNNLAQGSPDVPQGPRPRQLGQLTLPGGEPHSAEAGPRGPAPPRAAAVHRTRGSGCSEESHTPWPARLSPHCHSEQDAQPGGRRQSRPSGSVQVTDAQSRRAVSPGEGGGVAPRERLDPETSGRHVRGALRAPAAWKVQTGPPAALGLPQAPPQAPPPSPRGSPAQTRRNCSFWSPPASAPACKEAASPRQLEECSRRTPAITCPAVSQRPAQGYCHRHEIKTRETTATGSGNRDRKRLRLRDAHAELKGRLAASCLQTEPTPPSWVPRLRTKDVSHEPPACTAFLRTSRGLRRHRAEVLAPTGCEP